MTRTLPTRSRLSTIAAPTALALLLAGCGGGHPTAHLNTHLPLANAGDYPAAGVTPTPSAAAGKQAAHPKSGGAAAKPTVGPSASAATVAAKSRHPGTKTNGGHPVATSTPSPVGPSPVAKAPPAVNAKCRQPATSTGTGAAVKGQRPPDFTATTVDCKKLVYSEFTKGQPVLVNFFASWCHPCQQEAKDLESLYREWHDKNGFIIVGVETQDESGTADWFYKNAGYTFASVWDDNEKIEHSWNEASGAISTLPASFWIHPDGTVSDIVIGAMTHQQMEDEMGKL